MTVNISLYDGFITVFHRYKSFITMPWPLFFDNNRSAMTPFVVFGWPSERRSSNASLALCNFEALNSICEFRQLWSCLETCTRISVFEPCTCIRKRGVPSLDSRQMARTELSLGASLRFLPKLERHQAFHSGTKMRLPHTRYSVALQFQHSRLIIYSVYTGILFSKNCFKVTKFDKIYFFVL